jgi:hypothetical protein
MFRRLFGLKKETGYSLKNNVVKHRGLSEAGTVKRERANAITTVAAGVTGGVAAAIAIKGVAATAIAGTIAIPPLIPVMLAVLLATAYIMRQKGLNEELRANLYFIKMEIERMLRSINVIKQIAEERNIQLNTISLSGVIKGLNDKIMLFADASTKKHIQELEAFLKKGGDIQVVETDVQRAETASEQEIIESVTNPMQSVRNSMQSVRRNPMQFVTNPMQSAMNPIQSAMNPMQSGMNPMQSGMNPMQSGIPTAIGGGRWFPKLPYPRGWIARWLSPSETLRQIIRDVTIATVWYSIMLSEFDIFMRYMDIKQVPMPTEWTKGTHMKVLLDANRQLSGTNAKYDDFYKLPELKDAIRIVADASTNTEATAQAVSASEAISSTQGLTLESTPESPSTGGRRRTHANKKARTHRKRTHKRHLT